MKKILEKKILQNEERLTKIEEKIINLQREQANLKIKIMN